MKRMLLHCFFVCLCIFSFSVNAAEKWILDPEHSYITWKIEHLGFSTQTGKWYINGYIILDEAHPENSQVNVTIDLDHLITGIPALDNHLKGKLFLNTALYPKAEFVSKKVTRTWKDKAKVSGVLTLHGISKPVVLDVTMKKAAKNPINNLMTIGFSATTRIKRSDFRINTMLPELGDEILIEIGAEANPEKELGVQHAFKK